MLETEETQKRSDDRPPLQSEILRITSGRLLVIDQFMLGNAQFLGGLAAADGGESSVREYGGCLVDLGSGDWRVYRFPRERAYLLLPPGSGEGSEAEFLEYLRRASAAPAAGPGGPAGRAYIETRCVVFLDWERAREKNCLEKYLELRKSGNDKEARDYLREQGAAVRYGFNQDSDELRLVPLEPERAIAVISV